MFIPLRRFLGSFILTAIGLMLTTSNIVAAPITITDGYDKFRTLGNDSTVDFTGTPLDSLGIINVIGNPFLPNRTDTLIKRTMDSNANTLTNPGDSIFADVEIVGLNLVSEFAYNLDFIGLTGDYFLQFTINRDGKAGALPFDATNPESKGNMQIFYDPGTTPNGNPYDGYWLDCYGNTTDTAGECDNLGISDGGVWASVYASLNQLTDQDDPLKYADWIPLANAPRVTISCELGDVDDPSCRWRDAGRFRTVEIVNHEGPHPRVIGVPEPTSILLLSAGLALFGWQHRRKSLV